MLNKDVAHSVMTWLTADDGIHFSVNSVTDKKASRKPPVPFITSTLQQECSRKLNMNPSRSMSVAQELYEEGMIVHTYIRSKNVSKLSSIYLFIYLSICLLIYLGFITYMRTDSPALSSTALNAAR